MADEIYTFDEQGMRKLVAFVRELERGHSNQRRKLSQFGDRRVQQVYMPGSKVKIVTPKFFLFAAFGGGISDESYSPNLDYGSVESNALAISTGNYIPLSSGSTATGRNRQTYIGQCYVWEYVDGILTNTLEELDCINVTGLPIMTGTWCKAQKVEGGDYWFVTKMGEFANASKHFDIPGESLQCDGTEAKIVRGTPTLEPEAVSYAEYDWAHVYNNDVFIHHPGTYTINFGAEIERSNNESADTTRYTDSGGSQYIDLPNPAEVQVDCLLNWNPLLPGTLAANWPISTNLIYMSMPARGDVVTAERTIAVNHTLDNWHGQPYLRLSLAFKVGGHGTNPADTKCTFRQGWIHIRPEGGGSSGGNEGTGYNVFLGASGAPQWWGGGTAPGDFDEDGVAI